MAQRDLTTGEIDAVTLGPGDAGREEDVENTSGCHGAPSAAPREGLGRE
ncbi:MAG TPA: hypothetical protein VNR00_09980 [Opitutus sp.]|nr:hypothetical protein [Opitutus sp.]